MTRPNCEAVVADNLKRQGFVWYLPRYLQKIPNKTARIRPLFPRYIFVFITTVWYCLLGTRGVSRVLMGDKGPEPVSDGIIHDLQRREDKQGLVRLEPVDKYSYGARVKVRSGPLMGYPLIYEGMNGHDRVKVLAEMLGRSVSVELEEKLLVAA